MTHPMKTVTKPTMTHRMEILTTSTITKLKSLHMYVAMHVTQCSVLIVIKGNMLLKKVKWFHKQHIQ